MRNVLHILVEQKDIRIEGRVGSVLAYGVNAGSYPDEDRYFLSFQATISDARVVRGEDAMRMHGLSNGSYLLRIPVSGPDVGFTMEVAPARR